MLLHNEINMMASLLLARRLPAPEPACSPKMVQSVPCSTVRFAILMGDMLHAPHILLLEAELII